MIGGNYGFRQHYIGSGSSPPAVDDFYLKILLRYH